MFAHNSTGGRQKFKEKIAQKYPDACLNFNFLPVRISHYTYEIDK